MKSWHNLQFIPFFHPLYWVHCLNSSPASPIYSLSFLFPVAAALSTFSSPWPRFHVVHTKVSSRSPASACLPFELMLLLGSLVPEATHCLLKAPFSIPCFALSLLGLPPPLTPHSLVAHLSKREIQISVLHIVACVCSALSDPLWPLWTV